jgi:hypothetical protein
MYCSQLLNLKVGQIENPNKNPGNQNKKKAVVHLETGHLNTLF